MTRKSSLSLRTIHKFNAVILILFGLFHMGNHMFLIAGPDTYNTVQDDLNTVYRFVLIEPILIASMITQAAIGLVLLIRSFRQVPKRKFSSRDFWEKAQLLSGIMIVIFISQHLFALGMLRWTSGLESNFYWPASVMNGAPFIYYFAPYYFLGVLALFTHVGVGLRYWAMDSGKPTLGNKIAVSAMGLGLLCATTIVLSLAGVFYEITLPAEWHVYLSKLYPNYAPPQ